MRAGRYHEYFATASAAANVSVGAPPVGGVAAVKRLAHASGTTRVMQPVSASAIVAKFAIVWVWLLLRGPRMAAPQPPVVRSTKFGKLPAAIRNPSALPWMT